jgi:hypothetical protein
MVLLIIGNLPGHLERSIVLATTRRLTGLVAIFVTFGDRSRKVIPVLVRLGREGQTKHLGGDCIFGAGRTFWPSALKHDGDARERKARLQRKKRTLSGNLAFQLDHSEGETDRGSDRSHG